MSEDFTVAVGKPSVGRDQIISIKPCCVKADMACFIVEESEKDLEKTKAKLAYTIWTEAELINFVQFINRSKVQVNYYYSFGDSIIYILNNSYMSSDVILPYGERIFLFPCYLLIPTQCSKRAIAPYSHIISLYPHNSLLIQPSKFFLVLGVLCLLTTW